MNRAILCGRLSTEVTLNFIPSTGMAAANFSIAVDRGMSKDKKEEAKKKGNQTADFIRCKVFGKTAELIANNFDKGKQILVDGSIQTGSYEKDGVKHYTTDVLIERFEFIGEATKKETAPFEEYSNQFESVDDSECDVPF